MVGSDDKDAPILQAQPNQSGGFPSEAMHYSFQDHLIRFMIKGADQGALPDFFDRNTVYPSSADEALVPDDEAEPSAHGFG